MGCLQFTISQNRKIWMDGNRKIFRWLKYWKQYSVEDEWFDFYLLQHLVVETSHSWTKTGVISLILRLSVSLPVGECWHHHLSYEIIKPIRMQFFYMKSKWMFSKCSYRLSRIKILSVFIVPQDFLFFSKTELSILYFDIIKAIRWSSTIQKSNQNSSNS